MIYFDNASTFHPKPKEVIRSIERYIVDIGVNPGRSSSKLVDVAEKLVQEVRNQIALIFNVRNPNHIVFTYNATHAINMIIHGYFNAGDHVLVCSCSHNAALRPIENLKKLHHITYDIFKIGDDGKIDEAKLISLITDRTRMIMINHASNVTGVINDLMTISQIAQKYKLDLLADCTQSTLYVPIDVELYNITFLIGTGHKTLMGPSGIGFAYIKNPELVKHQIFGGSNGNHSISPVHPHLMPYKFEAGTLNFLGISGLSGSLDYIRSKTITKIIDGNMKILQYANHKLSELPEVVIHGKQDTDKKVPIISFNIRGRIPSIIAGMLDSTSQILTRAGLHCAPIMHKHLKTLPTGSIRLSFNHLNTTDEVDQFICALKQQIAS